MVENDTKRKGGDYKTLTVRNVKECARACANDQTCQSFNYVREHRDCWLKYDVPDGVYSYDIVSGYKVNSQDSSDDEWTTGEVAGVRLYDNVKRNGGDYNNFTVKNVNECAMACANDKKCRSFNYGKKHKDCWLKHSVPKGVRNKTVISGVKLR